MLARSVFWQNLAVFWLAKLPLTIPTDSEKLNGGILKRFLKHVLAEARFISIG
jgi:hypothetical protein